MELPIAIGGEWNESGLVNSLSRKGFVHNKCGSELIANSADAGATYVKYVIDADSIKLFDNGDGMNLDRFKNMCNAFRANNNNNKSMGVSGIGGTIARRELSKNDSGKCTMVITYTKTNTSALKAVIPWDEIDKEKVYTGKVKYYQMSQDEIHKFNEDRDSNPSSTGTTIVWMYSEQLHNTLLNQFDHNKRLKNLDTFERWDLIFGIKDIGIIFENRRTHAASIRLPKYDYFGLDNSKYYNGKNKELIHHYEDTNKKDRYIWQKEEDEFYEIKQTDKICKTVPDIVSIPKSWCMIGTYEIYNGMLKDNRIFDESCPYKCLDSATLFLSDYESYMFDINGQKDKIRQDLSLGTIYRNDQLITGMELEGYNGRTARGGGDSLMKTFLHRTSIRYSVLSTQDNKMDITMGIQENKNQHSHKLPKTLERLITYLKKINYENIMQYFEDVKTGYNLQKRLKKEQLEKEQLKKEQLEK